MSRPDPDDRPAKRARHSAAAAAADPDPIVPAAAAAIEEEEEEDNPQPISISTADWSKFKQDEEDPILDPTFCVECRYATCKAIAIASGNQKWMAIMKMKENRFEMHRFTYVREIQRLYDQGVRYNLTDNDGIPLPEGFDPGPWPAQQIWEHDHTHVVNPDVFRVETARSIQFMMRALGDNICFRTRKNPAQISVDVKAFKEYVEGAKKAQPLFDKLYNKRT